MNEREQAEARSSLLPTSTGERWALAGILLLALAIRVTYVLQMRASPYFDDPQMDQGFYAAWGRALAEGTSIAPGPMLRAPLYAIWLSSVFKVFGYDLIVVRLLQAAIGTGTVLLTYLLARRVFDSAVARVAALLGATYWILVYYDAEILREPLALFFDMLALLLTLRLVPSGRRRAGFLAGVAWGLSALLRPQVLAVVPFIAVWIGTRPAPANFRARWLSLVLGVLTPILPVTAYNWIVAGDPVLISSESGYALWIGNNPAADGVTGTAPGTRADWWGYQEDAHARAEREVGRNLQASEVSTHYWKKTLRFFVEDPAIALRLMGWKTRLFLANPELGSNPEEPAFFADRFAPVTRFLPLNFAFIASMAVLGIAAAVRRRTVNLFPLLAFLGAYSATVILFTISARHRLPVIPVLLVFSGGGIVWLVEVARSRRWKSLALGLSCSGFVFLLTQSVPVPEERSAANGLAWLGSAEARAGRLEEAERLYEQSIELSPEACDSHRSLGVILDALGRPDAALSSLRTAIRLCPDDVEALDAIADLRIRREEFLEAEAASRAAIAAAPHLARGHFNLGRSLHYQERAEEAVVAFRTALDRNPRYFKAAYSLGMVLTRLGRKEEAARAFAIAVSASEDADESLALASHTSLIAVLVELGREPEAREYTAKMKLRFPQPPKAKSGD